MGTCIICGTSVDGLVCSSHEEDVAFTFGGDRPGQLEVGRFYRGTVDGMADFGVFVDIGESVTGLLHRSELDRRLESLTWEPGDEVFVQVIGVHDNGNVDLGWSIRQSFEEFRGSLVQTPEGDRPAEDGSTDADDGGAVDVDRVEAEDVEDEAVGRSDRSAGTPATANGGDRRSGGVTLTTRGQDGSEGTAAGDVEESSSPTMPDRVPIESVSDRVGSRVTVEGRVVDVRQTTGPTIFTVRDETGVVSCAGFDGAGVRSFPDVEGGDVVRLFGEVEQRRGDIQIEIESMSSLDGDAVTTVDERMERELRSRAKPDEVAPLAEHEPVTRRLEAVADAATAIRRAVFEHRRIVVRHTATADGYVAGAALERSVLPLIREEHERDDAEYRLFDREPLKRPVYDMRAATPDVTRMLDDRTRRDASLPLVVLVDVGTTEDSLDGISFLDVYGAPHLVINAGPLDDDVADRLDHVVQSADGEVTTTVLASTVAGVVNGDVRAEIGHLPALSYWDRPPAVYQALAEEAGFGSEALEEIREAIELEAYYQSYEDKRELVADLLFTHEEDVRSLASHVSEQFRDKLERALRTARPHVDTIDGVGLRVALLDTDAYTHRFDFPPTRLLVDALHRELRGDGERRVVTVGLDSDEAIVRGTADGELEALADHLKDATPGGNVAVTPTGGGARVSFLVGERDQVRTALVDALVRAGESA